MRSALAGAAALGLTLVAGGCTTIEVAGIPDPRNMIVIEEGTPYVVPPGKRFIVTALGVTGSTGLGAILYVDGAWVLFAGGGEVSIAPVPPHFIVESGYVIRPDDNQTGSETARTWGYLIDA